MFTCVAAVAAAGRSPDTFLAGLVLLDTTGNWSRLPDHIQAPGTDPSRLQCRIK